MNRRFDPAGPLRGRVAPPADKSISHRAALFGAMSDEPLTVRNYLYAEDTLSTLTALRVLGAGVDAHEDELVLRGVGLRGALEATGGTLDVGNSGTLLRLLPGWLAGQAGGVWTLDGDESIRKRPVDRIVEPLGRMGAKIEARDGRLAPLRVGGAQLHGIEYDMPVASAQVKSCLLIAGLMAEGVTRIREPHPSRDHTERILLGSHASFSREDDGTLSVSQLDELEIGELTVPGDPSSAAFWIAAATLIPDSRIVVDEVGLNWTRTGFIRIAERMGAVIVGDLEEPGTFTAGEPVGDLDVASSRLEATDVEPAEVPLAIDEIPLVALLAVFAEGETVVRGAGELRVKESDRIMGVVEGLGGLGADIEATDDGFVVRGTGSLRGGTIESRGDHRLAMLGAIAGLASEEGVVVEGFQAVRISYPTFERDLERLLAG
ncbi:MAG: 3-phosphoshikimate 1-carboxyvinyltransferase [Thermoleophilaceae bacterium]|nr:3-phosphoshikimate 1-carboxyvinyltransferase [Thermoleophilaceae bacterium]